MPGSCNDCGVVVGQPHQDGCDVARCLATGQQRISCDDWGCHALQLHGSCEWCHDCGRDVWTGVWPGVEDCRRLGWFCYFGPDCGEVGWVRCPPDHPRATEDLNRLAMDAEWNPVSCRWEARP